MPKIAVERTPERRATFTYSSWSLGCLLRCELYRLLERQSAAFLPGAVEGSVICDGGARCGPALRHGRKRGGQAKSGVPILRIAIGLRNNSEHALRSR